MATSPTDRFVNVSQLGGIERYTLDDGPGRGVRALCVNTGAGLHYRVLVDRGLDIDQAFFHHHSLTFLAHNGPTAPSRAYDRGLDWLKSFPVGLLTSCGPFSTGAPTTDQGEELGLHGTHSNSPASLDAVFQPDPYSPDPAMTIVGRVKYGPLYGPSCDLKRTIRSYLHRNVIAIEDEFTNPGNTPVPHAWLLHINFGYPLLDDGSELRVDAAKVEPVGDSGPFFQGNWKRLTGPQDAHRGPTSNVAYLYPRADADGRATVAIANPKLSLAVAIRYNTREFPRCANWQHLGPREYVTALEPANGGVEGRDKDRALGWLDSLAPGAKKTYRYEIEVLQGQEAIDRLPR
jgi:hypothetical protein